MNDIGFHADLLRKVDQSPKSVKIPSIKILQFTLLEMI